MIHFLSRLFAQALGYNVINIRTVEIYLHKSPASPGNKDRAISKMPYRVLSGDKEIQQGTTGADGKIQVQIRGGTSILELTGGGAAARYEISEAAGAMDGADARTGQKQRLRLLGYQIGNAGADGDGVDGNDNYEFERSVLDFQLDNKSDDNADVNASTQNALTTQAGG